MDKLSVMRLFGDHMILQCDVSNRIFGTAPASAEVVLTISDGTLTTEICRTDADNSGRWAVAIPPFPASFKEYTLVFSCGDESITASDVLFGELYHISGQSNMELPISRTIDPLNKQIPPDNRYIREFRVPVVSTFGMDEEYDDFLGGQWKVAVGADIMPMSGAGYWFADELSRKLNVPVGLVNTAAGGSPVEARLPYKTLMRLGGYDEFLYQCTVPDYQKKTAAADADKYRRWSSVLEKQDNISKDIFTDEPEYKKCTMPFYFRDVPELDGLCGRVWFRKVFILPDDTPTEDALLILGTMTDADKVYVNGTYVGETGYMYPPRIYNVPASVLKHGENTIHVLLEVRTGQGGFIHDKKYCLKLGNELIDLTGEWGYAIGAKGDVLVPDVFFQGLPLSMYGAMTAPAFGIRFRGMLWYQAESNGGAPERYYTLFKEFVEMYRKRCGYEIPVIITQLPNFEDPAGGIPKNSWAELREQQKLTLSLPNTAMAVTIGAGESNDLHPRNKRDVGKRLAYCAERLIYNDQSAPENIWPVDAEYSASGDVLVTFNGKVKAKDKPGYFEALYTHGAVPAKAVLTDKGVLVSCGRKPQFIRYAWMNDPSEPELFSEYDLPLSPFAVRVKDSISVSETMLGDEIFIRQFSPEHGSKGSVILCHGYNQNVDCTSDMAEALAGAGYQSFAFDFRGGGAVSKSRGSGTEMSIETEIKDLERVIDYVKGQSVKNPDAKLYVYGESQGGFVSALACADRKDITALALEYPAFCIPDQWLGKDPDDLPESFEFMGHVISKNYYLGVPRYDVYERISHFEAPVLIMQGTADKVVDTGYAHKINACYKNSELILYPGEDHGFSHSAREKQKNDIIAFLDRASLPEKGMAEYNEDYYRQLSVFESCD